MSAPDGSTGFDFSMLDTERRYKLLSHTIVPRPIAWVSTIDAAGRRNLAPFSFFNVVATNPPLIVLGITARPFGKDTVRHIRETGEFVVNLVPFAQIDAMNVSAIEFPAEVDEFEAAGLEHLPSFRVRPPRVAMSPVSFECKTFQLTELESGQTVVMGEVLYAHVTSRAVIDVQRCYIDTALLDLVGRMDNQYVRAGEVFKRSRLTLADWQAGLGEAR
jgi:flavin reductase (DIM6/NTAB) family NADH-FMN oxidoreductase RutF